MVTILTWIYDNWQLVTALGVLLIVLGMTGNITRMVRAAKDGLKESLTPMGFVILLIMAYLIYRIWLSIAATI